MKIVGATLLIILALAIIGALLGDPKGTGASSPAQSQSLSELVSSLKLKPSWARINARDESHGLSLTLYYRTPPSSLFEVETDTKSILRSVIKLLISKGRNPGDEHLAIFVWGQKAEAGETGKSLVRVYGSARYSWVSDQITFEPSR